MNFYNLTINFLGDSITEGVGATSKEKCFVSVIGKKTGATVRNYGIGGTRIAKYTDENEEYEKRGNFCTRMKTMEEADVCVVFGGTNDYGHGTAPFGEFSDRDESTFYGACHKMISYLADEYGGKTFFIITPLHRLGEENKNMHGKTLKDYVDAIREVAEYYSVPVLDLWAESGLCPAIESHRERFMPDGLHPSDVGHEILADKIISYIKKL